MLRGRRPFGERKQRAFKPQRAQRKAAKFAKKTGQKRAGEQVRNLFGFVRGTGQDVSVVVFEPAFVEGRL